MKPLHIAGAALLLGLAGTASATTINFADLERGTSVSNQFAGVSFSLSGGPGEDGSPLAGWAFGGEEGNSVELLNSTTEDYPTSASINIEFSAPASNVSFRFNNYGFPEGGAAGDGLGGFVAASMDGLGRGFTTWTAYDINDDVIGSADIWFTTPYELLLVGSGVKRLVINNGSNPEFNEDPSWMFGVSQLNFDGTVPEPGTWAMMILGFGAIGMTMRRRQTIAA